jgi:two-component system chemotaxis sensor kinase CheA
MVDVIADPLVHMVRNACDHGLEHADARVAAGKSANGTLMIRAQHSEGSVVIELIDDGKGLDRARILARAIDQGLVAADATPSDADVFRMIFLPGFSTAEKVTDMSGRGVGMDVVRRAVESLSGRIEIESTPGRGTTFRIRLPLTLAITDGMLVRVGEERYIIPTVSIAMSMRSTTEQMYSVGGDGKMVSFRGRTIPVFRLADLAPSPPQGDADGLVVVLNDGDSHSAVLVDEILGKQQVVTKALGDGIPAVRWIAGGAILGDGRVGLIVDPSNLLARFRDPAAAFLSR